MRDRAPLNTCAWGALLFLTSVRLLSAQTVHGVVRDSASTLPIAGAVVMVSDASGHMLARTLSDSLGRYTLSVANGGTHVRALHMGFHARDLLLSPQGTRALTADISMSMLPSLLEPVGITAAPRCPKRDDAVQALGLWEQARVGLLASVAAREASPGRTRRLVFRRLVEVASSRILRQEVVEVSGSTSQPFVASRPASDFATHGFMAHGSVGIELDAPDADVLLDESFAATHCFGIQSPSGGGTDEIGLTFTPAPGRDGMVDVSGVLQVDRVRPAIRTLSFVYTGLPQSMPAGAGGTITFRTMPNGIVFVERWDIGSPMSPPAPSSRRPVDRRPAGATGRLEDDGGQVTHVVWKDGAFWESTAATATVTGRVFRSSPDVRVWLEGTSDTTTVDSAGVFRFEGLLDGPYVVGAAEPALATYGVSQSRTNSVLNAVNGRTVETEIHLETADDALRATCGKVNIVPTNILFVRVVNADNFNFAVAGDSVDVRWPEDPTRLLGVTIGHEGHKSGTTRIDGVFAVCDPPRDRNIEVRVFNGAQAVGSASVVMPAGSRFSAVQIQLRPTGSR